MSEPHQSTDEFLPLLEVLCKQYWAKGDNGRAEIYQQETVTVPGLSGSEDFSATYSVIDLGVDLCKLFPSPSPRILLRQEYKDLKSRVHEMQHDSECQGMVIPGQPGIGKSCFLLYLLIERVLDGEITTWSSSNDRIYLLGGPDCVQVHAGYGVTLNPLGYPGAWALVDANDEYPRPHNWLTQRCSNLFVIQATLPWGGRWEAWSARRTAGLAVMKPWSWEEIFVGGTQLQSPPPLSVAVLEKAFVMYGSSANQCFEFARNEKKMANWEQEIPRLLENCPDLAMAPNTACSFGLNGESMSESLLSRIFCIVPTTDRLASGTLVSAHVAEHVCKELDKREPIQFQELYDRFLEVAESQDAAKWLKEAQSLHHPLRDKPSPVHSAAGAPQRDLDQTILPPIQALYITFH